LIEVEHDDNILRTFILFTQTARGVLKYTDCQLYREAHLSIVQFIVLQVLNSIGNAMTPSEIAEWTQTERHNITQLVKRMKKEGLVTVERDSNDGRAKNIILTNKGREVLDQAMPVAREIIDHVMLSLGENEAILLEKTLQVLRRNAQNGLEYVAKFPQPQSG